MRTSIDHKVYFHDLDQPEIMVPWGNSLGPKGTPARRKRMKPETLLVEWRKEADGTDWVLWEVYLMGRYVHAQSSMSISHHCYQFRRTHEALWSIETPDWVHLLVERARPRVLQSTIEPTDIDMTQVAEAIANVKSAWEGVFG